MRLSFYRIETLVIKPEHPLTPTVTSILRVLLYFGCKSILQSIDTEGVHVMASRFSTSCLFFRAKMATVSMNEVESLKDTFRIRERRENNHDMEDLMTGTDDIKLLSTPSLRDLDISQPASTICFHQANLQSIS